MSSHFEQLAAINVNDKLEKKNGLSYLSWAWAWDRLLRADPDATHDYGEPRMFGETMMVFCTVSAFGKPRTAHLPVMDHRNKPIPNPDAFQVNTAMQRCLVKAIALHGIGLYVYAGEDLPDGAERPAQIPGDIPANSGIAPDAGIAESLSFDQQQACQQIADECARRMNMGAIADAVAHLQSFDLDVDEKSYVWRLLDSKHRTAMRKHLGDSIPRKQPKPATAAGATA